MPNLVINSDNIVIPDHKFEFTEDCYKNKYKLPVRTGISKQLVLLYKCPNPLCKYQENIILSYPKSIISYNMHAAVRFKIHYLINENNRTKTLVQCIYSEGTISTTVKKPITMLDAYLVLSHQDWMDLGTLIETKALAIKFK